MLLDPNAVNQLVYAEGATLNPSVPYEERVAQLCEGDMVEARGWILPQAKSFAINLNHVADRFTKVPDIVVHFNPRFHQKVVVRNTRLQNKWGDEERTPGTAPLQLGEYFQCLILAHKDGFKIAVNGKHYTDYKHRLALNLVNMIQIEGDISLFGVNLHRLADRVQTTDQKTATKSAIPQLSWYWSKELREKMIRDQKPLALPGGYNLPSPYMVEIPGGFQIGAYIYMTIIPASNSKKFRIALRAGARDGSDVAFQYAVSFEDHNSEMNAKLRGEWGVAHPVKHFPFRRGCHADIIMRRTPAELLISVNGDHVAQFGNRVENFTNFPVFVVQGDVSILHVRMTHGTQ